jgi:pyruvate/2-oxoglutarate dehydrogenase complex dihydrolipoamide dehydrogenase (E3) component
VDPEIAHVGMYEKDAEGKGIDFDSIKVSLEEIDRAQLEGTTRGFLKITFEKKKGRILGATLVADHAGDMICQVGSAIKAGLTMGKLSEVIYPYPTQAEIFRRAGDIYNSRKLTPLVKKLVRGWLRFKR